MSRDAALIRVHEAAFHVLPMRTRFPFRYGIASMTALPHLFLELRLEIGGRPIRGLASEGLPPKWFTKDPGTTFEEDLPGFETVIRHAVAAGRDITAPGPLTMFRLWRELARVQATFAADTGHPPLLASLGVSLVERACLDGLARALDTPFHRLVRANALGIDLAEVHGCLRGVEPRDVIAPAPAASLAARHTVGLGDPLTTAEVPPGERVEDGLPQTLEECIDRYGLTHFKVKLAGDDPADHERLERLAAVLATRCPRGFAVTLDGNENYPDAEAFRASWERFLGRPRIRELLGQVLFVEQPVHRRLALAKSAEGALSGWPDRPPMIIDESDGTLEDAPRAFALGYAGVSHKNCKGVIKGLVNAALVARRRAEGHIAILSSEDLANVGPVALLQDLAVAATLGIGHSERNGHHYFRGLAAFPDSVQEAVLAGHGDLYRRHDEGFACLAIEAGRIRLGTVNRAPFGLAPDIEPAAFARPGEGPWVPPGAGGAGTTPA